VGAQSRRAIFAIVGLALLLSSLRSFARIPEPEGMEDLQWLGASAPFIFHANVVGFNTTTRNGREEGFAILTVDRSYKEKPHGFTVRLRFRYDDYSWQNGHDCIDLRRADSWLIFAVRESGDVFDFSDDCEGGLPMSSILAPNPRGTWDQELQQDLIAGLHDPDPAVRLANIARLGGLKLPSSATALHEIIDSGSSDEREWAIYAALRSRDMSVLPQVEAIVTDLNDSSPTRQGTLKLDAAPRPGRVPSDPKAAMTLELQHVRDPKAVPELVRIMSTAKTDIARDCRSSFRTRGRRSS
jgi:hypothetical protein